MKTGSPLSTCWILLGLSLCLTPAFVVAQDRSSRGLTVNGNRKQDTRRYAPANPRLGAAPPSYQRQSGWFSSGRRTTTTSATVISSRPQEAVTTRVSSTYGTGTRVTTRDTTASSSSSSVSFLPDGTVITQDGTYIPPMTTTVEDLVLNPLAPNLTMTNIQFPNSAMAPPPPPVSSPQSLAVNIPKQDVSSALRAELVSPGLVKSPYPPYSLMDVQGLRSGSLAQDPASKKLFRVP